ncbi:DUF1365 domain-containing protein [Isoalcanivorax indicus]|uniref:DUF1365 domain-containing protein n=1 Tax=Isoalcanivorax indicus TaxID=2202653 RepID=UPI000DB92D9C|nr:DUF1365 domain-containing protein [Isoalcanivorax indicus]
MKPEHGLYSGCVWHQRERPVVHRFSYPLWLLAVDIDDTATLLARHRWWGRKRRPVVLRDRDYLAGEASGDRGLSAAVRDKAAALGMDWQQGRVIMLAQPRLFGWLFNPLVLYWHFAPGSPVPDQLLAEVSNTPWHQTHWYPLVLAPAGGNEYTAEHDKGFHVSPFMAMAQRYRWTVVLHDASLTVRIENWDSDGKLFTAGMTLDRQEADALNMGQVIRRFGWQSLRVSAGIYAQAFRLWRKGVPFHGHPDKQ